MTDKKWQEYVEKTKSNPPRALLIKALEHIKNKDAALDLGSGALNDVRHLVSVGFKHITAVDSKPVAAVIFENFPKDVVSYVISTFDHFAFEKNAYDLINAQYALPFNPSRTFDEMFAKLKASLKQGGVFTGQFFGMNDEWNTGNSEMTFHTKEQVESLIAPMNVISFTEEEADRKTAKGVMKHWHVYHVIAARQQLTTMQKTILFNSALSLKEIGALLRTLKGVKKSHGGESYYSGNHFDIEFENYVEVNIFEPATADSMAGKKSEGPRYEMEVDMESEVKGDKIIKNILEAVQAKEIKNAY